MKPTPILDRLEKNRIFSITKKDDGVFEFTEECDCHFSLSLSSPEMVAFISELQSLLT